MMTADELFAAAARVEELRRAGYTIELDGSGCISVCGPQPLDDDLDDLEDFLRALAGLDDE